jgi:hypothetical protein
LARPNGKSNQLTFEAHYSHHHGAYESKTPKIRSTSKTPITSDIEDISATTENSGTKNHLVYAVLVDQGQLYTDLTGKFPVRSSKGNWYVMVCYIFDCNYINVVPMKSRSASEWVKAYDHIHQELTAKGFKPKLQTLDNEASVALKNFFTTNAVEYQLVPPTVIAATPLREPFELLKNTLWQGFPPLIQHFDYICGTYCFPKRKSL